MIQLCARSKSTRSLVLAPSSRRTEDFAAARHPRRGEKDQKVIWPATYNVVTL